MTTINKNKPVKKQSHAFRKDIYLLGYTANGENYWLESPSWDCGWYWGFGYVETYTNNGNPAKSKDITSHQHIDGFFKKGNNIEMWKTGLIWHTYTKDEAIELNALFTAFYELKEAAGKLHDNSFNDNNIQSLHEAKPVNKDHKQWLSIVTKDIPSITKRIIEILTPTK